MRDGKEWNFKATQFELPQVIDEVRHSFEAYWCDATFEDFIPGVSNARLKKALGADWETPLLDFSALDLMRAKDYQQEILERLDVERNVHGHFRNLVVAATGTGKTVIAAFDAENGGYPPTQNGDIRSLFWLFSLMALQN